LPGVGFKTADVVLMLGHDIPAIAVDTHVNRISKRLGLVGWEAGVEEVKRALESVIPRDKWRVINRGLVLFGRDVCRPVRPRCHACPLAAICDFSQRVHRSSNF
jgi:endonuclease-3